MITTPNEDKIRCIAAAGSRWERLRKTAAFDAKAGLNNWPTATPTTVVSTSRREKGNMSHLKRQPQVHYTLCKRGTPWVAVWIGRVFPRGGDRRARNNLQELSVGGTAWEDGTSLSCVGTPHAAFSTKYRSMALHHHSDDYNLV